MRLRGGKIIDRALPDEKNELKVVLVATAEIFGCAARCAEKLRFSDSIPRISRLRRGFRNPDGTRRHSRRKSHALRRSIASPHLEGQSPLKARVCRVLDQPFPVVSIALITLMYFGLHERRVRLARGLPGHLVIFETYFQGGFTGVGDHPQVPAKAVSFCHFPIP